MIDILKNISESQYRSISSSTSPNSKHYELRKWIIDNTTFLDKSDPSLNDRIYCLINNITEYPLCKCGCDQRVNRITSTYLPNHGNKDQDVINKKNNTCLNNYGVLNPSQSIDIKNAKKKRSREKYGTDHYMQNEDNYNAYKNKLKISKNVENTFQLQSAKDKIKVKYNAKKEELLKKRKNTYKLNFYKKLFNGVRLHDKVTPLFTIEEFTGVLNLHKFRCNLCNNEFISTMEAGGIPRCLTCYPKIDKRGTSNIENEIYQFVKTLDPFIKAGDRKLIYPLELDIVSHKHKIAIELDGLYWHSELNGKDYLYHLNKTNLCKEKNYRLIHIFEDEWIHKQDIIKSKLKSVFGIRNRTIYARKCTIKEIDVNTKNEFLDNYHIQGSDKSVIKLGLFYENELVNVMTFCKTSNKLQFELSRFCSIDNTIVIGGASKLLSHFKKNYQWESIISYADIRFSVGNLYEKIGFKLDHISEPNVWYMKDYINRVSIIENHDLDGYDRIWDCGNLVYILKNS